MLKRTVITAAVLAFSATAVQAQDVSGYLQGSLGYSETKFTDNMSEHVNGLNTITSTDKNSAAYKLIVGVQLNSYVALEAQYVDLGSAKLKDQNKDTLKAKNRGFGGNLVGTLPIGDLNLFAKAGLHRIKTSLSADYKGSTRETVTSYGGGLSYNINEEFTIVADYERYRKLADIKDYHIDVASVGLRYNF